METNNNISVSKAFNHAYFTAVLKEIKNKKPELLISWFSYAIELEQYNIWAPKSIPLWLKEYYFQIGKKYKLSTEEKARKEFESLFKGRNLNEIVKDIYQDILNIITDEKIKFCWKCVGYENDIVSKEEIYEGFKDIYNMKKEYINTIIKVNKNKYEVFCILIKDIKEDPVITFVECYLVT